jgi:hypothetical protein
VLLHAGAGNSKVGPLMPPKMPAPHTRAHEEIGHGYHIFCIAIMLLLSVSLHVDGLEVEPLEGGARLGVWWDPVVPDPAWVPVRNL